MHFPWSGLLLKISSRSFCSRWKCYLGSFELSSWRCYYCYLHVFYFESVTSCGVSVPQIKRAPYAVPPGDWGEKSCRQDWQGVWLSKLRSARVRIFLVLLSLFLKHSVEQTPMITHSCHFWVIDSRAIQSVLWFQFSSMPVLVIWYPTDMDSNYILFILVTNSFNPRWVNFYFRNLDFINPVT